MSARRQIIAALAEAKVEVVAWLVKKDRENTPVGHLASKVDRGAVRIFLGTGHYQDAMDAHRAEVLAEVEVQLATMTAEADRQTEAMESEGADSASLMYAQCVGLRRARDAVRRRTVEEASAAAATATPDFFVPGRVYTNTDRYKLTVRFACEHATVDPQNGRREAWGWLHRANGSRRMERKWADDFPNWTPAAGDGRG